MLYKAAQEFDSGMSEFDTPFGKATLREDLARGVIAYDVEGSHIIFVSKFENVKVPSSFRKDTGWYEEKHQRILAVVFPNCFAPVTVRAARRWLCEEHPDVFEDFAGVIVFPSKQVSVEAHRERFYKKNKRNYIEIKSWTDKCENVPKGHVLVEAALGGDPWEGTKYFLILEEAYEFERSEYGFVCMPGVHRERELV